MAPCTVHWIENGVFCGSQVLLTQEEKKGIEKRHKTTDIV